MKSKFSILTLVTLITVILVGCDNEETKELKSLNKLGYEYAVKEYNSYEETHALNTVYGERQAPVTVLERKIANESPIDKDCDEELYEIYNDLKVEEYQNSEKIEALLYGYRDGIFDSVKNSVEFISSNKGKKSIDNFLNGLNDINGYEMDEDIKATIKDTILMYSDSVLEQLDIYEKENGKYTGEVLSVGENLTVLNDKLSEPMFSGDMAMQLFSRYAYMNIWYQQ